MTRKLTIGILVAVVLALIAWDVYALLEPSPGDTISEVTLAFARQHPAFSFLLGVVAGHLLWPQEVR